MIVSKVVSLSFLFLGIFLLMQIILPLISFQIWESKIGQSVSLISPASTRVGVVLGVSVKQDSNFSYFYSDSKREKSPDYLEFTISIPKLKIEKLKVLVDSNNLDKNLAHLPGTALPGEKGNVFISGHSAIDFFKNIKDAPFAKLQELKAGDKIEVFVGGVKFIYEVLQLKTVKPEDISVVQPPDGDGRYITLMTCVPPGLNFKRLVVLGKMI